jgi:hypothetical protein
VNDGGGRVDDKGRITGKSIKVADGLRKSDVFMANGDGQ